MAIKGMGKEMSSAFTSPCLMGKPYFVQASKEKLKTPPPAVLGECCMFQVSIISRFYLQMKYVLVYF